MAETEGVIKFNLTFRTERVVGVDVVELSAWRTVLKDLGLLGQAPGRYDGYGFGNISQRCSGGFVISGTQTGELDAVTLDDYAFCETWDLQRNAVDAQGAVKPSSESLSHASIYDVHETVTCALHAHSPDIWRNSVELGIAVTDESVAYGTPEMAKEVRRLITDMGSPGIFSMGGHEDGIFTFGRSLADAGQLMVRELVRARALM
jgi:ribulose-5-phosphate 4-epimerase/fuculose-1-phosphate aldolase